MKHHERNTYFSYQHFAILMLRVWKLMEWRRRAESYYSIYFIKKIHSTSVIFKWVKWGCCKLSRELKTKNPEREMEKFITIISMNCEVLLPQKNKIKIYANDFVCFLRKIKRRKKFERAPETRISRTHHKFYVRHFFCLCCYLLYRNIIRDHSLYDYQFFIIFLSFCISVIFYWTDTSN